MVQITIAKASELTLQGNDHTMECGMCGLFTLLAKKARGPQQIINRSEMDWLWRHNIFFVMFNSGDPKSHQHEIAFLVHQCLQQCVVRTVTHPISIRLQQLSDSYRRKALLILDNPRFGVLPDLEIT